MIRSYWNEQWKPVEFDDKILESERYKISSHGRVINCKGEKEELAKESFVNGYQVIRLRLKQPRKWTCRYVHKLVAEHFLEQKDAKYVIHLNYKKTDNKVENLKWVSKKEKEEHQSVIPNIRISPKAHLFQAYGDKG